MADFAEMDKQGSAPAAASAAASPASGAGQKPAERAKPAISDPQKPTEQATDVPKPVKAAELRTAYDGLKKRVREELEPEVQRLRQKVQELEGNPKPDELKSMSDKLAKIEQRNAELEKQISFLDYTRSSEYKEKYDEPYRKAFNEAVAQFGRLRITDDETGESRMATKADLLRLGAMNDSELDDVAQRQFGASAPRVIQHIERLRQLSGAKLEAERNALERAVEAQKQLETSAAERHRELANRWTEINKSMEERFPRAYKADETDPDDVAAHTKGFALANLMFVGEKGLTPEQMDALPEAFKSTVKDGKPLSDVQRVQLHALARIKMANHDRKLVELKKARARIKELEASLSQYESSTPDAGSAGRPSRQASSKGWLETAEDELRALDK